MNIITALYLLAPAAMVAAAEPAAPHSPAAEQQLAELESSYLERMQHGWHRDLEADSGRMAEELRQLVRDYRRTGETLAQDLADLPPYVHPPQECLLPLRGQLEQLLNESANEPVRRKCRHLLMQLPEPVPASF